MQQQNQLIQAFSTHYCKANGMSRVGKNITGEINILKRLWLAMRLYNAIGYSCDINCLLNQMP